MLRYRSVRKVSVWVLMCVRLLECVHAIAWVSKALTLFPRYHTIVW